MIIAKSSFSAKRGNDVPHSLRRWTEENIILGLEPNRAELTLATSGTCEDLCKAHLGLGGLRLRYSAGSATDGVDILKLSFTRALRVDRWHCESVSGLISCQAP
jgi:hypothetical protein